MRLLFDTNVVLAVAWENYSRIPDAIASLLRSEIVSPCISVASLWEIAIKWRLGKLDLPMPPDQFENFAARMDMEIVQVTAKHAVVEVDPWPQTRDPFDRLLLAQCQVEGLKLLTTDRALAAHPTCPLRRLRDPAWWSNTPSGS